MVAETTLTNERIITSAHHANLLHQTAVSVLNTVPDKVTFKKLFFLCLTMFVGDKIILSSGQTLHCRSYHERFIR